MLRALWARAALGRRWRLGLLAVAAIVTIAVVSFQIATREQIVPGVAALGRPLGGLSQSQAADQLTADVGALLSRSVQMQHRDRLWSASAQDLGLQADPTELAAAAFRIGHHGSVPSRLADQLRSLLVGSTVSLPGVIDDVSVGNTLDRIAGEVDRPPRDAALEVRADGTVEYRAATIGLVLDASASRARITQTLNNGSSMVDLVVKETPPSVGDERWATAREQLTRILPEGAADPLTLTFGAQSWPLDRRQIAQLIRLEVDAAPSQPARVLVDQPRLRGLSQQLAKDLNQEKQDARFAFNGGDLRTLRPSRQGRELDQEAAVALIGSKLLAGEHSVVLPVRVDEPLVSSDNPASLGIVERVETGSTSFSGSIPEKAWNIRLAAERLNGVVVPPGGVFSFNNEVGRTTIESGFKWGYGIVSGQDGVHTIPSVAGGICQVATTLFHPVFWAGYPLEERYWHLYWIPAYTSRGVVGLDVTVDEDAKLDFKWINPTDDYVLIQTATDSDTIYISLYGKKPAWKVETLAPVTANRVPPDPKPMAEAEPTLPWGRTVLVQAARDGFDVTVTRRVIPAGDGEARTLNLRSRYAPAQTLTLVGTAGIPPDASVEEALGRVLDPQGAAQNRPAVQATPTGAEQSGDPPQPQATAVAPATAGLILEPTTPSVTPAPPSPAASVTIRPAQ